MNKTGALVIAGFVFTCFQAHANGKVVSVLPEPVGDVYVLGSSTSEANATADGAVNYDYINWSALNVPAGSTVRLNGAIVLDAMPDNLTYDWSACTRLALVGADLRAAGKTLVVPANLTRFLAYDGMVTVNGESFSITKTGSSQTYACATELNAVLEAWGDTKYCPIFAGPLTGAKTGMVQLNNFGASVVCSGPLDFAGSLYMGSSQTGQSVDIYSPDETASVGTIRAHHGGVDGTQKSQQIRYWPNRAESDGPATLNIGYLYAEGEITGIFTDAEKYRRAGVQISVFSNNTVDIKSFLANKSPVGFFAGTNPIYKNKDMPTSFNMGIGNVKLANGGNMTGKFYVSPNINVTMTGNHAQYAVCTQNFYYNVETNIVNAAQVLTFKGVTGYPNDGCLCVYADEPMNLPLEVAGRTGGHETRTWLTFQKATWNMPFDFGAADVNPARCETDVKVFLPKSGDEYVAGTVYVRNVTTAADAVYPRKWTEYPIITFGALDGDFSNWTVVPVGWPSDVQIEKVVKANGLYVRIRRPQGLMLLFR